VALVPLAHHSLRTTRSCRRPPGGGPRGLNPQNPARHCRGPSDSLRPSRKERCGLVLVVDRRGRDRALGGNDHRHYSPPPLDVRGEARRLANRDGRLSRAWDDRLFRDPRRHNVDNAPRRRPSDSLPRGIRLVALRRHRTVGDSESSAQRPVPYACDGFGRSDTARRSLTVRVVQVPVPVRADLLADPRRRCRLLVLGAREHPPLDPVGAVAERPGAPGPTGSPLLLLQPKRDAPVEGRRLTQRPNVVVRLRLRDPDRQMAFHEASVHVLSPRPLGPSWVNSRSGPGGWVPRKHPAPAMVKHEERGRLPEPWPRVGWRYQPPDSPARQRCTGWLNG